jgi:hypothetical protein
MAVNHDNHLIGVGGHVVNCKGDSLVDLCEKDAWASHDDEAPDPLEKQWTR